MLHWTFFVSFYFLFDWICRWEATNRILCVAVCDPNATDEILSMRLKQQQQKMIVFAWIASSAFDADIESFDNKKKSFTSLRSLTTRIKKYWAIERTLDKSVFFRYFLPLPLLPYGKQHDSCQRKPDGFGDLICYFNLSSSGIEQCSGFFSTSLHPFVDCVSPENLKSTATPATL